MNPAPWIALAALLHPAPIHGQETVPSLCFAMDESEPQYDVEMLDAVAPATVASFLHDSARYDESSFDVDCLRKVIQDLLPDNPERPAAPRDFESGRFVLIVGDNGLMVPSRAASITLPFHDGMVNLGPENEPPTTIAFVIDDTSGSELVSSLQLAPDDHLEGEDEPVMATEYAEYGPVAASGVAADEAAEDTVGGDVVEFVPTSVGGAIYSVSGETSLDFYCATTAQITVVSFADQEQISKLMTFDTDPLSNIRVVLTHCKPGFEGSPGGPDNVPR